MRIQTTMHGDVTVLALSGELLAENVGKLKAALASLSLSEQRDFVIDLRHVSVADSAGLEMLTALQRQCEERLGMLRLCGADHNIRKVFELTRLDRQFSTHDTLEEALASFTAA